MIVTQLSDAKIDEWKREHIPYRLRMVDGLRCWCHYLRVPKRSPNMILAINGKSMDALVLTNSVAESGLMACRFLLEFLGVRARPDTTSPTGYDLEEFPVGKRWADDVWHARIGCAGADLTTDFTIDEKRAAGYTHKTASGGVAHPTDGPAGVQLDWIILSATAVTRVAVEKVYGDARSAPDTTSPLRQIK